MWQWRAADGTAYLGAGLDVAVRQQVFVQPAQQLVEVGGRVSLSVALARQVLVAVFLQLPECTLLLEQAFGNDHVHVKTQRSKVKKN